MSTKSGRICPNCQNELSHSAITLCLRCGNSLKEAVKISVDSSPLSEHFLFPKQQRGPISLLYSWSRNQRKFITLGLVLIMCLPLMLGLVSCKGVDASASTHTPTPTPIPMVRLTIKLVDVVCNIKQGFGHNKFYMMTTFDDPDKTPHAPKAQSQLTPIVDITNKQDLPFIQSPFTVFDGVIPPNAAIAGGFTSYNDTNNEQWAKIGSWVASITKTVGDALTSGGDETENPDAVFAGFVLDLAVAAWYNIAVPQLNKDNAHQLGYMRFVVPASGPASEDKVWRFYNTGGLLGYNSWDYTVRYQIIRTTVTT